MSNGGDFAFSSKKGLELGSIIIQQQFSRFRLEMHVGSNTKVVSPPPPHGFFKIRKPFLLRRVQIHPAKNAVTKSEKCTTHKKRVHEVR